MPLKFIAFLSSIQLDAPANSRFLFYFIFFQNISGLSSSFRKSFSYCFIATGSSLKMKALFSYSDVLTLWTPFPPCFCVTSGGKSVPSFPPVFLPNTKLNFMIGMIIILLLIKNTRMEFLDNLIDTNRSKFETVLNYGFFRVIDDGLPSFKILKKKKKTANIYWKSAVFFFMEKNLICWFKARFEFNDAHAQFGLSR